MLLSSGLAGDELELENSHMKVRLTAMSERG